MKKGYSIIQVVISMTILVVILGTVVMVSNNGKWSNSENKVLEKLQNDAIIINKIYQNEIRSCESITVLEEKPDILERNKGYIFIDSETDTLMLKEVNSNFESIMYIEEEITQDVLFKKVDNRTISAELMLEEDGVNYDVETKTVFKNMPRNADVLGDEGTCLQFNYNDYDLFLKQFTFYAKDNKQIKVDSLGLINDDSQSVTIEVDTDDITNLIPNISIFGKCVSFDSINS